MQPSYWQTLSYLLTWRQVLLNAGKKINKLIGKLRLNKVKSYLQNLGSRNSWAAAPPPVHLGRWSLSHTADTAMHTNAKSKKYFFTGLHLRSQDFLLEAKLSIYLSATPKFVAFITSATQKFVAFTWAQPHFKHIKTKPLRMELVNCPKNKPTTACHVSTQLATSQLTSSKRNGFFTYM